MADVGMSPLFDANRLDLDEPGGVGGLETAELIHTGLLGVIQAFFRVSRLNDHVALIELQPDGAIDGPLTRRDCSCEEFSLGREEIAVIENAGEMDGEELVPQCADITIQGETLEVDVCCTKDGGTWGFVAPSRLDTNEAVFDDIDTANTVFAAQSVQGEEDVYRVRDSLLVVSWDEEAFGEAAFEVNSNDIGGLWGLFKALRELPHVAWRGDTRIFQDTCFVRDVEEVLVGRPWLGGSLLNRNVLLGSKLQKSRSSSEPVVKSSRKMSAGKGAKLEVDKPGILQGAITLMSGLRP